jgi:hypothetical protein
MLNSPPSSLKVSSPKKLCGLHLAILRVMPCPRTREYKEYRGKVEEAMAKVKREDIPNAFKACQDDILNAFHEVCQFTETPSS